MPDTAAVDQPTYEIVVFGLRQGVNHDQLVETSKGVSDWAAEQRGFIDRKLLRVNDEKYVDIVRWNSMEEAMTAAELAESSPQCAPMFALIDMESVSIFHGSAIQQSTAVIEVG